MRRGVRLGIDVGKARIGVSRSDPHGSLAVPVETIRRDASGDADVRRIVELAAEYEVLETVVGLPLNLTGDRTPSTDDAEHFASRLAVAGLSVRLVDERLSTVSAMSHLHAAGKTTRNSRSVIDQAAAVVILQHALESERTQGSPPGTIVEGQDEPATHTQEDATE